MRRHTAAGALALATVLAVAGCGGQGGTSGHGSTSGAAAPSATTGGTGGSQSRAARITIRSFAYAVPKSVRPSAKITVHNGDDVAHTVTADHAGGFDVKVPGSGDATMTAPAKPGRYPFHCTYHSDMHGVLVVR